MPVYSASSELRRPTPSHTATPRQRQHRHLSVSALLLSRTISSLHAAHIGPPPPAMLHPSHPAACTAAHMRQEGTLSSCASRQLAHSAAPPPQQQRHPKRRCAAASFPASRQQEQQQELDVVPTPPPKAVRVIHSTAYMQQTQQLLVPQLSTEEEEGLDDAAADVSRSSSPWQQQQQPQQLDGNALVWALKKMDQQLDRVEADPSEVHQALYKLTSGPVGQATGKTVVGAAKLTMGATLQAAKAAAPVGKWALTQGFKAAAGLVGAAMQREAREREQQRERRGGAGKQRGK